MIVEINIVDIQQSYSLYSKWINVPTFEHAIDSIINDGILHDEIKICLNNKLLDSDTFFNNLQPRTIDQDVRVPSMISNVSDLENNVQEALGLVEYHDLRVIIREAY